MIHIKKGCIYNLNSVCHNPVRTVLFQDLEASLSLLSLNFFQPELQIIFSAVDCWHLNLACMTFIVADEISAEQILDLVEFVLEAAANCRNLSFLEYQYMTQLRNCQFCLLVS